jgi:hypothetical protein
MDFIDDKDFVVVRKNLNIFSVVILLLAFTNANISILNLFGITVKMDGQKVYVALFVGYVYFIWRYLTKLPLMNGFWNDFLQFYLSSASGVKKQHTFERHREKIFAAKPELEKILKPNTQSRLIDIKVLRFPNKGIRELRLIADFYVMPENSQPNDSNLSAHCDIVVSRGLFLWKFIIFCFRNDKFGDYLFPIALVLVNLYFFLFHKEWQGSFRKLF